VGNSVSDIAERINWWERLALLQPAMASRSPQRGIVDGATFILDQPKVMPAIWGEPNAPLWVEGEGFMITGPQGAGKTTLAGQLVLALCGLRDEVLGLPVKRSDGPVVYLAMDRPRQIARSFARMVSDGDRKQLRKSLKVWQGPPPVNVVQEPASLCQWARDQHGARYVVIDSYKDLAADLSDGTTGAAINAAVQECVAEGIGWLALHHHRKAQTDNSIPSSLADVYGSGWLTAGLGSVLGLWGEAGDDVVEARHLKPVTETLGTFGIRHDHRAGVSEMADRPVRLTRPQQGVAERHDAILDLLRTNGDDGLTKKDIAAKVNVSENTVSSDLKALAEDGSVTEHPKSGRATHYTVANND
jgi:predicted transcriptional regulator